MITFQLMSIEFNPLTPKQQEKFRSAANTGSPYERLAGLVLLDTGLRRDTFSHMRDLNGDKWYRQEASPPEIHVPPQDECKVGFGHVGDQSTRGEDLCSACNRRGENYWVPKTESAVRRVWVHEEDTQEAIENWFTLNNIVSAPQKVNRAINEIAERAEFDRNLTPHNLRQTYGSRLAHQGHNAYEIRDLMGHSAIETGEKYVKLFGNQLKSNHIEKWQ